MNRLSRLFVALKRYLCLLMFISFGMGLGHFVVPSVFGRGRKIHWFFLIRMGHWELTLTAGKLHAIALKGEEDGFAFKIFTPK